MQVTLDSDVRPVLPTLRARTLVIVRKDSRTGQRGSSEDFAERLPDAQLVEVEGDSPLPWIPPHGELLEAIQEFLVGTKPAPVDDRVFAAVLFTDIVDSTQRTSELGDRRWRETLDAHDLIVRREVERFRGRVIKTTGDGVLATFDGPARAVRCAQSVTSAVADLALEVRAGVHAGEVEVRGEDVTGIAVNLARRVSDLADSGQILVSRTVTDLVAGSGLEFEDRGDHELKGVPGRWQLYAVV